MGKKEEGDRINEIERRNISLYYRNIRDETEVYKELEKRERKKQLMDDKALLRNQNII